MKNAKTAEIPIGAIRVQETISVWKNVDRLAFGSCNACADRDHKTVTNIGMRGLSFRLCDSCRKILKDAL